jgi:BASS family bile acid:Na+ symporter
LKQCNLALIVLVLLLTGLTCVGAGYLYGFTLMLRMGGWLAILAMLGGLFVGQVREYRFTLTILIANFTALLVPQWFQAVGDLSLTDAWLLLIVVQAIMFGMGTQMSLRDFGQVVRIPGAVCIGLTCQFMIMPILGFSLARLFQFPPEIGAGLILVGSCSSGLASNVLTFLAKGNLALSVTMTALATAMAPIITPIWMEVLAGTMIEVNALQMSLDIVKMVIVPLLAAFVSELLQSPRDSVRRCMLACVGLSGLGLLLLCVGVWQWLAASYPSQKFPIMHSLLSIPGFIAAAFVVAWLYRLAVDRLPELPRYMPQISMGGIVYFTLVTTAKGRDQLLAVGLMLLIATILHNLLGYLLGYWGARLMGMNQRDARTVAIEVGTQNGAMATGLARGMNKLETVGLAAVIFAPLMNVTGSILANHWRRSVKQ